jgi:hypothetical protein
MRVIGEASYWVGPGSLLLAGVRICVRVGVAILVYVFWLVFVLVPIRHGYILLSASSEAGPWPAPG